ncbi:hypothetical protein N8927_04980, partial [Crocinitomicaceae bacterium]|nr:hypothetical protein [Crocinitomicaceae bacterium]
MLLGVLFCFGNVQGQTVAFTSSPIDQNDTIYICQNQTITYTNTSSDLPSSYNLLWNFDGGSPNTSTSSSTETVNYPTSGMYNSLLIIDSDTVEKFVIVGSDIGPQATLLMTNTNPSYSTATYNGYTLFRRCGTNNPLTNSLFSFEDPNFSGYPSGTIQYIDWGNGNTENFTGDPSNQAYNAGEYTLTYSVEFPNGCIAVSTYLVFVGGDPPTLSIGGQGEPGCVGFAYSYTLGSNSSVPGTSYEIIYSDGSPTEYYSSLPTNPVHVFDTSSCGSYVNYNSLIYNNQFNILVTGVNGCNPTGTIVSIGPMAVSTPGTASFEMNPGNTVCVSSELLLNNTSYSGEVVDLSVGECTDYYGKYWEISPSTGYTVTQGQLGNPDGSSYYLDWTNGSDQLGLNFDTPGEYIINLTTGNSCGNQSVSDTICVMPGVVADYNLPFNSGCAPLILDFVNNSSTPTCDGYLNNYNWTFNYANPENCGSYDLSFLNGTDSLSTNPRISFNEPGQYIVTLSTDLSPNLTGSSCSLDTYTDTITVIGPPLLNLETPNPICINSSFSPISIVNECYGGSGFSYNWLFGSDATPSTTNQPNPIINYSNPGTQSYNLTITNSCGSVVESESVIVQDDVNISANATSSSCEAGPINLSGSITGGATTGTWTSNILFGSFNPSADSIITIYTPPAGATGVVELTLTSDDPNLPCVSVTETVSININDQALANAGPDTVICSGVLLGLEGSISGAASSALWTTSGDGDFSSASNLNATYTPGLQDNLDGSVELYLTTDDPIGPCEPYTDTLVVGILPLPETSIIGDFVLCSSDTLDIAHSNSLFPETTNYYWSLSNVLGVNATPSGSGIINFPNSEIDFVLENTDTIPLSVEYSVYAETNGCIGPSIDTVITINPEPQIVPFNDIFVCPEGVVPFINFVSQPYTLDFDWINDNTTIGLASNGTGNIDSWIAPINASNTINFGEIQVTPTLNECFGDPFVFNINIKPIPTVDSVEIEICSGDTIQEVNWSSNLTGSTFTWNSSASASLSGFVPSSGTGVLGPYYNVINSGDEMDTITVSVYAEYDGCTGPIYEYFIFVKPLPSVQTSNVPICPADTLAELVAEGLPIGGSYDWVDGPNSSSYTVLNPGNNSTYIVNYTLDNCIAYDTATVEYKIVPDLSVNNDSICEGQFASLVLTTSPPSAGTYLWTPGLYDTQQIEVSPPSSQTYSVSFVDSLTQCELTSSGIVYVDTIPEVEISATDIQICSGDFTTLTASSNIGGGTFLWSTGETTPSISVSPLFTDTFNVVYTKNNCFDSVQIIIDVIQSPSLNVDPLEVCYGSDTIATASGLPLGGDYLWYTVPQQTTASISFTNLTSSDTIPVSYTNNGCTIFDAL